MVRQPRFETLEATGFFADGASARPLPAGTVPREPTGWEADGFLPLPAEEITIDLLRRGRQRYDIYCSACHARDGYGNGMVVQRGFPAPPSLHEERLRRVPDAHLYNVVSNGLGNMPPYGGMIPPADRTAIIAYLRAMQRSQNASIEDVPADRRDELDDSRARRPAPLDDLSWLAPDSGAPDSDAGLRARESAPLSSGAGLRARESGALGQTGQRPVPRSQPAEGGDGG